MLIKGKNIELLAPAGNMERLVFALHYGADAVYCGGTKLGLRAQAGNFDLDQLHEAVEYTHSKNKKIYVTLNAYIKNSDLDGLSDYIKQLAQTGIDALIISDPATIMTAKEVAPDLELHLSTQANTLNYKAAKFWHDIGIKRVVLAREHSLEDIKMVNENTPESLELEAFVHGAMCVSYSGRCLLSNFFSGRDANQGECSQPCRWNYEIKHRGNDSELYPIEQDENGTYIMNSRDMMLIEHLEKLVDAGVSSFKIEGRMKTAFYVASVVNAYKMAFDDVFADKPFNAKLVDELNKLRHRPYSTGFYFPGTETEKTNGDIYLQTHDFVAVVKSYDAQNKRALIQQRNRFFEGDELEVLSPMNLDKKLTAKNITTLKGEIIQSASHPMEELWIDSDVELCEMDILRKKLGPSDKIR